jgi:hypothetical protein
MRQAKTETRLRNMERLNTDNDDDVEDS